MNSTQGQEILRVHAKTAMVKNIQKKTDQSIKKMDYETVNTVVNELTEDYSSNAIITDYFNEQTQTMKDRINKRKENLKSKSKNDMHSSYSFNEEFSSKPEKLNTGQITSKMKSVDFNNFDEPSLKNPNLSIIEDRFDSSPDESLTKFDIGKKMPKHLHIVQSLGNSINKYIEHFTEQYSRLIVDKAQEEIVKISLNNEECYFNIMEAKYSQIHEMEVLSKKDTQKTQDEAIKIIVESLEAERDEEIAECKVVNDINMDELTKKYQKLNIRDLAEFKKLEQRLESDVLLSVIDAFGGTKKGKS